MLILHSKTALNRPPRILCSENAFAFSALKNRNSVLQKCKFCTQTLHWCSKQTGQNSAFRKWKFCAQEMEILCLKMEILHSENGKFPQCHGKYAFPRFSAPNWASPHNSVPHDSAIVEFSAEFLLEGLVNMRSLTG